MVNAALGAVSATPRRVETRGTSGLHGSPVGLSRRCVPSDLVFDQPRRAPGPQDSCVRMLPEGRFGKLCASFY